MLNINPLLLVGGVIGAVTALLIFAYASVKDKKTAMGFERTMADGEILRRLFAYAKPYWAKFLLVLFLNRRSSETKENGPRESLPDCQHHLAECRPVALIDDEHHPFRIDVVNCVRHGAAAGILADTAHLLDRSDNQSVIRAVASQFVQQIGGVFCCLDRLIIGREPLILAKALRAEFDTVHQEDHFIGVT